MILGSKLEAVVVEKMLLLLLREAVVGRIGADERSVVLVGERAHVELVVVDGQLKAVATTMVLLLLIGMNKQSLLLVLASLVLEPDANDARVQAGDLHQMLLQDGVRSRIGVVAGPQRLQLLLVEHRADAGRFRLPMARVAAGFVKRCPSQFGIRKFLTALPLPFASKRKDRKRRQRF